MATKKMAQARLGMILPAKLYKRAMALAWPVGISEVVRQLLQQWVDDVDKTSGLRNESPGIFQLTNKAGTLRAKPGNRASQ